MLPIQLIQAASGNKSFTVKLSGETIANVEADPTQARAWIIFNTDGTVDKREGGAVSQIDTATDWIIPNSGADGIYEVRYTNLSGDAFTVSAAAADTWIALTAGRTRGYTNTSNGTTTSSTADFQIRLGGGGGSITSANYSLSAQRTA